MRIKSPLAMMEQIIMVLVFALASAVCLRVFVWSDGASQTGAVRDQALFLAQNAAELLKDSRGDYQAACNRLGGRYEDGVWSIDYDRKWQPCQSSGAYLLEVQPQSGDPALPLMGSASVQLRTAEGQILVTIPIAWQEVSRHG